MKILIIDNNIDPRYWGSADLRQSVRMVPGADIYVRRGPHDDLPKNPKAFDRIIISGSKTRAFDDAPWIDHLLEFIRKAVEWRRPLLGVCYGHQALARALGGKEYVRQAEQSEFGWTQIEICDSSPLFQGLPKSFYSFSAHFDEVSQLPKGLKRLAFSKDCQIQAFQLENQPIFGIQFHPEKTLEIAKKVFAERRKDKNAPRLLHPNRSEELYNPKIGEIIFKNFLQGSNT